MSTSFACFSFNRFPVAMVFMAIILTACGGGGGNSTAVPDDGLGPTIACDTPIDGAILSKSPGLISMTGTVQDLSGVSSLQVNGASVAFDSVGSFATQINAIWGINFVNLNAVDGAGHKASRTCAFLLSNTWAPDTEILSSTISLKARQAAFDDNNSTGAINSLADILYAVLNSNNLATYAKNHIPDPIYPYNCLSSLLGVCVLSNTTDLLDVTISGPISGLGNTSKLTLINGGLTSVTNVSQLGLHVRLHGQIAGIPYDVDGWVGFNTNTINANYDIALIQGQPKISVLKPVNVSVGSIAIDINGLPSQIDNLLNSTIIKLAQSYVENVLSGFIADITNIFLNPIVSGLDVHNLPNTIDVPRFDGSAPLTVNFATNYSTLVSSSTQMLVSLGTQFHTAPAYDLPTLGAPIQTGQRVLDIATGMPISAAVHSGLLNQVLYALWRGGYFDVSLGSGALNGVIPANVSVAMAVGLPPAALIRDDGRVEISLGAVNLNIDYPMLLQEPVDLGLGGRVSCAMHIVGDKLTLDDCTVDELHVSPGSTVLDGPVQTGVEQFLTDMLGQIVTRAGNAFPALPIPEFPLTAANGLPGIPTNSSLGLVSPVLSTIVDHMVLQAGFGTIIDNGPVIAPTLAISDLIVSEDAGSMIFTVTRSGSSSGTVTVNYSTIDGSAIAGDDYTAASGTLTFNPGEVTHSITVPIIDDTVPEPTETLFLNLSGATNATISDTLSVGTIIDNDSSLASTLIVSDVIVSESAGSMNFTVTRSGSSSSTVMVNYWTTAGSAHPGSDYADTSGTLTFNPGEVTHNITVPIIDDTVPEPSETLLLNLSGATNATISDSIAVGTIIDNDPP